MKFKSVDEFNLYDCVNFLIENPKSELINSVKARLEYLKSESAGKNENKCSNNIKSYRDKMKWVDFAQFNEKKIYKNFTIPMCVCVVGFIICTILSILSILSNEYYGEIGILFCALSFGFFSFFYIFWLNSSPLNQIYNIEDGDPLQIKHRAIQKKNRVIQNKRGKMGICKLTYKIKQILPCIYDDIFMLQDNSYICKRKGKVGIFNIEVKKMLVPVIYDEIHDIQEDCVELIKDNQVYYFNHKGYRFVK